MPTTESAEEGSFEEMLHAAVQMIQVIQEDPLQMGMQRSWNTFKDKTTNMTTNQQTLEEQSLHAIAKDGNQKSWAGLLSIVKHCA